MPAISKIRTLQSVYAWLKTTENWVSRMLSNLPGADVTILTDAILPGSIHVPTFQYLRRSITPLENPQRVWQGRAWNFLLRRAVRLEEQVFGRLLRGHYDLIHSHFSFVGWQNLTLARVARIPHLVSFYGVDYESFPYTEPQWRARYQRLFQEADAFICEGSHGVKILERMGCSAHKLKICRLGVDLQGIPFAESSPGRENGFHFVQIASLTAKKGHGDAIRSFAMALPRLPQGSSFTIVGREGDVKRSDLEGLTKTLGIAESVHFLDGIDFTQLYPFLSQFHAFFHPSCYTSTRDCEGGAPVVLLDAQAVGLPVVSTTHCDIPDEVLDGVTGFLSPEGDVESLAGNLVRMAHLDPETYSKMRQAGRHHIETNFDAKSNSAHLQNIYSEIIGEYTRSRSRKR